ncbi:LysR family transcriptional regulator [Rudaeicoccus suwonensis]|uniref:DNA-binding transcriptional LysR family regulator n=1 Tax=Rudaeicoccus suwonensis TaxID=657409 RepID=A0A561E3H0_9MICO|nr:LysR family transcriptional regulator [Rudaeicoccus suwonensis]TWE10163.1 DNA-binding transcriptional LysR family regulator [Rudaeicoccus suwonensis]
MYDLQRLRALHAVRQHGSVAAAAEALGFTPSAISQQINKLEREVGSTLLERAGRGVLLTDAAIVLADATDVILTTTEEASAQLEELRSGMTGTVRLMCFPTAIRGLVAPALRILARNAPGIHIEITEGWLRSIELVESGHVDLVVTHDWTEIPAQLAEHLTTTPLLMDPVDLVVPADHRLAGRKTVTIDDVLGDSWITDVHTDTTCGRWLVDQFQSRGAAMHVAHRIDEYPSQMAIVAAGQGIALMPRMARPNLSDQVVALALRVDKPVRRIFSVCRQSSSRRPVIRTINKALQAAAQLDTKRPAV